MYSDLKAAVNLGGHLTEWFGISGGVRQGDNLAPTLFAMFINSLTNEINQLNEGITIDNGRLNLSILLFADDIVLISETETGLQRQLNALHNWVKKNRMACNMDKTKIVHFRNKNKDQTNFNFKLGAEPISKASNYKYLGLTLDEFLDFGFTTDILATSGSRALGALTSKYFSAKGLLYKTYAKLYRSTVIPVLNYAAPIWGIKKYHSHELIQQRAMRTFLGVGKKTPIPGLYGEMGWRTLNHQVKLDTIKYWLRLYNMENSRIPKQIFMWDYRRSLLGKKSWNKNVKEIFTSLNMRDTFYGVGIEQQRLVTQEVETNLVKEEITNLQEEIKKMPKLRTYRIVKQNYETEPYLKLHMNRYRRSLVTKIRLGVLPINIELGRRKKQKLEERTCPSCPDQIEDETHFLLTCPLYNDNRLRLFNVFEEKTSINLNDLPLSDALFALLNLTVTINSVAKFIEESLQDRERFRNNNR